MFGAWAGADVYAFTLRPEQDEQFGGFWGPFGDAMNKVLDKGADPTKAVADACKSMNDANGL